MKKSVNGVEVECTPKEEAENLALWKAEDEKAAKIQYSRDRAAEYPSVVDQLDMIYHIGLDGWKAQIKKIKDKYPKPI